MPQFPYSQLTLTNWLDRETLTAWIFLAPALILSSLSFVTLRE